MKLVVTVVGKDRVGIIATVSSVLAENNVNIISINQNIMNGFFNMVLIAEMNDKDIKLQEDEVQAVRWVTLEEFEEMLKNKEAIRSSYDYYKLYIEPKI